MALRAIPVDVDRLTIEATGQPVRPAREYRDNKPTGRQETDPETGYPMWQVPVFLGLVDNPDSADPANVKIPSKLEPTFKRYDQLTAVGMTCTTSGPRQFYRAKELRPVPSARPAA